MFKNTKQLTFSDNKLHRFFVIMLPAAEKTRSEGTDVAGAHKYLLQQQQPSGIFTHSASTIAKDRYLGVVDALLCSW